MPNILVVEDDERIASLIERWLVESFYEVTIAVDGLSGKELALSEDFDLVILDVLLPKLSGLDLCREIRSSIPFLPIIMITSLDSTEDILDGFDAGADDYMAKPFDFRVLNARISVLLKRKKADMQAYTHRLIFADLELNLHTKIVTRGGKDISLTPKEMKLLQFMIQNPNRVLSRQEIAENVWGMTFDTGTNFIDVYINYLRKKIDKDFAVKLIHTKPGLGFIFK